MEFERALFRVYDRSLESIQLDSPWFGNARPSVILKWSQKILMIVALGMIVLTATLHTTFVEQPGCLKQKLETYHQNLLAINPNATGELLPKDVILRLAISQYADPAELVPSPSEQTASVIPETKNVTRLSTNTLATDPTQNGPGKTEFDAKYEFSVSFPLMLMDGDLRSKLGVRELNITLEHTCFGATPFDRFLVLATGHDTPVINMLMFSLHSDGLLKNMFTKEEWSWGKGELPPAGGYSPLLRLALKPLALLSSLLAFFLMSSVTALIVRVLISSGVVFMFPLFSALERAGLRGFNQRLLRLSYPWLGAPMEELQRRGKPTGPFVAGHLLKVVVYYALYEAAQVAWAQWLYGKSTPAGLEVWLFGSMMLWEYYGVVRRGRGGARASGAGPGLRATHLTPGQKKEHETEEEF